ncbi:hypothetical protein [Haloferax sp. ATB1]|uniref:hypothetical protein n=1 Tax=Haloferax sp. ATB1 TaxID=1508454 RepID=UPI000693AFE6|nr:hypothetical protein [Haloferax sp. ATB1]
MAPKRDGLSVLSGGRVALGKLVAATSVLYTWLRGTVTSRPLLKRIWHGVVGRRRRTSVAAVLSAPIAAIVTGPLVAATYGYSRVEQWVLGTLNATDPNAIAVIGIVVLVAVAAAFAARNSGLVPTIGLTMGPIFGIGLARYGMMVEHFSPSKLHRLFGATGMHFETVGPLETLGTAVFLACLFGIPLGTVGFTLGTISRKISGLFGRRRNGTPSKA